MTSFPSPIISTTPASIHIHTQDLPPIHTPPKSLYPHMICTSNPLITKPTMSSPEIPTLHSKAEYLKAVMYEGVTILEGTATWCQQCKVIAPEVAKMVGEYPNVRSTMSHPYFHIYSFRTFGPLSISQLHVVKGWVSSAGEVSLTRDRSSFIRMMWRSVKI
jgi:thiol-disulfide isomerase/thioredoxin